MDTHTHEGVGGGGLEAFGMLEKAIENKLRKGIKAIGGLCLKWESPGFTGVPDRMMLLPGGRVLFAETKAPGKKERKRQEYVHKQLRDLGFTVYATVDSEAKVQGIIRDATQVTWRVTSGKEDADAI